VLPLNVVLEEIVEWVELASGPDAWRKAANRDSLRLDLDESIGGLGDRELCSMPAVVTYSQARLDSSGWRCVRVRSRSAMRTTERVARC